MATVDLNGDGYDELLVGAPMYSIRGVPEVGQVYVYRNLGVSLLAIEPDYDCVINANFRGVFNS